MVGLVKRKVQATGRALYVAIPRAWARANGVVAGDEVEVIYGSDVTVRIPRSPCPDCGAILETIRIGEFMGKPFWGYRCRRCGFREGLDE